MVKVVRVKGYCPVYNPGNEFFTLLGYKLRTEKKVCLHALASLFLDPCEYTEGETVVFEIRRLGHE